MVSPLESMIGACTMIGSFVKFVVEMAETNTDQDASRMFALLNAFSVMMTAQRSLEALDRSGLPQLIQQRTQKDKLYNDLIELARELELKWRAPSVGAVFLKKLASILWYADGHHDTIHEKSSKIPQVFDRFNGYNCPQASKHRKNTKENLKREELSAHALTLQEVIHAPWMQKDVFTSFRESVVGLRDSLTSYATYLQCKAKYQQLHHMMEQPSANPTDNSVVRYVPKHIEIPACLKPLSDALQSKSTYQPLSVSDFASTDRRRRYIVMSRKSKRVFLCRLCSIHTLQVVAL